MLFVVIPSKTSVSNKSCKNIQSQSLTKCISTNPLQKYSCGMKQRKIRFDERVRCIYYELEAPVQKPRPYFLTHLNTKQDKSDLIVEADCMLESFKLAKYQKYFDLIQIEGYIIVKNFSFEKKITIRYTLTDWKTYSDIEGFFVNSIDSQFDRFMFTIRIDTSLLDNPSKSNKIFFAIIYSYNNQIYWDNYYGKNYQFQLYY